MRSFTTTAAYLHSSTLDTCTRCRCVRPSFSSRYESSTGCHIDAANDITHEHTNSTVSPKQIDEKDKQKKNKKKVDCWD